MNTLGNSGNKGLCRAKHDTTVVCQQGNVEQVYIKIKCEHSILLHSVNCGYDNVLDSVIC
jgi:hypothetical protein